MVQVCISIFAYLPRSPAPNNPPEPIAYKLCTICQLSPCLSAHGFKNEVILANLNSHSYAVFAKYISKPVPNTAPGIPNPKKYLNLVPAINIITETTIMIINVTLK